MTPTRETFGNIPPVSQALFYGLAVAAVALFAYGVWRRVRLWRAGLPSSGVPVSEPARSGAGGSTDPTPALPRRLAWRQLLVEGLGQKRVRGRGLPSWAHALLFAGFLMLFLGTTLLELDHLAAMISDRLKFHQGAYYVIYEFTLDVFGLLFLLGGCLFLWRRLCRPASVGHRPADWAVLLGFLAIGVTGYLVEGLRMVWQRPDGIGASCSPVGLWVASWFSGISAAGARQAHLALWWLHSLLVFGFIAAIPFTRLFHLIAGPLNLLLARPALGQLEPVTMEQVEREERLGVRDIRHLTWQQRLSLDACMECGRCEEACPAFATHKPLSPKRVVQDLKGVMENLARRPVIRNQSPVTSGQRAATGTPSGSPAGEPEPLTNVHEVVGAESLWACTACSACSDVCPVRVDPVTLILELRRHLVAESALRGTAATALRRMQSNANPWGLPPAVRTEWTQALNTQPTAPGP